jgi:hypothetical protein
MKNLMKIRQLGGKFRADRQAERQMDGHDTADGRFSQLCERA